MQAGELPALRDAKIVVSGFPSIVDHLRQVSNGQWDLDADLNPLQRADCFAYVADPLLCL